MLPEERVLLVVDIDGFDVIKHDRDLAIDWETFRAAAPRSCSEVAKRFRGWTDRSQQERVAAALDSVAFSTLWPRSWPTYELFDEGYRRSHRYFEEAGFIPRLSKPERDTEDHTAWTDGDPGRIAGYIRERAGDYDTLIVAGDALCYLEVCQWFAAERWRSFVIDEADQTRRDRCLAAGVPLVDATTLQIRHSQTIRPLRRRKPTLEVALTA